MAKKIEWINNVLANREYARARRAGLSKEGAEACADGEYRRVMARPPVRVHIPRWRCQFNGSVRGAVR
jgi:hypothetical protein